MVFIIPEDKPNEVNQAVSSLLQQYGQRESANNLARLLGIETGGQKQGLLGIEQNTFGDLSPAHQQMYINNMNEINKAKQEQNLLDSLFGMNKGDYRAAQESIQPEMLQGGVPNLQNLSPEQQGMFLGLLRQIFGQQAEEKKKDSIAEESEAIERNEIRKQTGGLRNLTDKQRAYIALKHPKLEALIQSREKAEEAATQKELARQSVDFEKNAARHWDIAKKIFENTDELAEGLIVKENALNLMKNAIENRSTADFNKDLLANITGVEALRSKSGAEIVTAGKEYLLGNLSKAGARPNQWIEQQISKALPDVGRTDKANKAVIEMLDLDNRIARREIELRDEIASQHEQEYGYVRRTLGSDIQRELKKYAERELKRTENNLRNLESSDEKQEPLRQSRREVPPQNKTKVEFVDPRSGQLVTGYLPNDQVEDFIKKYKARAIASMPQDQEEKERSVLTPEGSRSVQKGESFDDQLRKYGMGVIQ